MNKEKYANNEADHEEPMVTDIPVVKDPGYFNIFECGKNTLNKIDGMCKQVCRENSRD